MFKNLIGNIIDKGINKSGTDLIENIQKFISQEYEKNKVTPTTLTDAFYKQLCEEKRTKEMLEDIRKLYNIEQRNNCLAIADAKKIIECNELNFGVPTINIGFIRTKIEENYYKCNPQVLHMITVFVDRFIKTFFDASKIEESKKKLKTKKLFTVNINLNKLQESPLTLIFDESDCFKEFKRSNPRYMDLKKSIPDIEEKQFKKHIDKLYNTKDNTYEFNKEYFALILDVIYSFLTYIIKSIITYTNTIVVKKRSINETHFQMCIQQLIDRIGNKNLNKVIESIWNEYNTIIEEKKSRPKKASKKKASAQDEKSAVGESQPITLPLPTPPPPPVDEKNEV